MTGSVLVGQTPTQAFVPQRQELSVARSTRTTKRAAAAAPVAAARQTKTRAAKPKAAPPAPTKGKTAHTVPAPASGRGKMAAPPVAAAAPTRVPPPSKGELRAQIETLETANAALKVKSREANRAAKAAARRIAELEGQVAELQDAAAKPAPLAARPVAKAKTARRGRSPGRQKAVDPGDAVPPGVAVAEPEPLDAEAEAARDALEDHLSGE